MVKIKKNNLVAVVPYSTYENHYKDLGWEIRVKKNNTKIDKAGKGGLIETTTEGVEDEINLSAMSVSQLREYAARNGIDISGGDTKKEIRNIIEAAMAMDI